MPPLFDIKAQARSQLRPMVEKLARRGVTPVQLSWTVLGLSAFVGTLIGLLPSVLPQSNRLLLVLPAALLLRLGLEAAADMLADDYSPRTRRGQLLRDVGDALGDVMLLLPLALIPGVPAALVVTLVALGLCTEVAGLAGLGIGASRRRDGPMNRTDRTIVFGLAGLILALDTGSGPWLPWLLLPASLMALITIGNRIRGALAETAQQASS
ncbi:MAG: hypothetical protein WBG92_16685 [Thiohalocapsa sp.]